MNKVLYETYDVRWASLSLWGTERVMVQVGKYFGKHSCIRSLFCVHIQPFSVTKRSACSWLSAAGQDTLAALNRQQLTPLLYSFDIWPARNSSLMQRETNHYLASWASVLGLLAWFHIAGSLPKQLVVDLFVQHQQFAECCPLQAAAVCHDLNGLIHLSCCITIWYSKIY